MKKKTNRMIENMPKESWLSSATVKIYQEPDTGADSELEGYNEIKLSTANGGGGNYMVIEISRWAIDETKDIEKLSQMLKEFYSKACAVPNRTYDAKG